MTVFYLPIEPLEERYSAQMVRWVVDSLKTMTPYKLLLPKGYAGIESGQWLDTHGTTIYRARQLAMVALEFAKGSVKDGDIFLLGDVWYPGIENIKLMAELDGVGVKVVGWHHAGCFDVDDLLAQKLSAWGPTWEKWLLGHYVDAIAVGSNYHKKFVEDATGANVVTVGQVWRPYEVARYAAKDKVNIVAFTNRYAPEKNPEAFWRIAQDAKQDWRYVMSTNNVNVGKAMAADIEKAGVGNVEVIVHANKADFYTWLGTAKIWYSAAHQETFGYSLHEAIALGLHCVAPNRRSYAETLPGEYLFDDEFGLDAVLAAQEDTKPVPFSVTAAYSHKDVDFLREVLSL